MILLLGASGYIGQAFARELAQRQLSFIPLSRRQIDYSRFDVLLEFLRSQKPAFVINAAGYTGKPNVDACELAQAETFAGNALLPQSIANACAVAAIPWGHVSSGCVFSGGKICADGTVRIKKNLTEPGLHALAEKKSPAIQGFTETDVPNFSFRDQPCSFYSGTKALGEEAIRGIGESYVWRLRIPFDEFDNDRNYLSKIQRYEKVYENVNSISHRGDFVKSCLDLWEVRAPFGTYNVTNPGFITTGQVVKLIKKVLQPAKAFDFWKSDEEFYRRVARTPRANCVMDVSKLLAVGIKMRCVEAALEDSLRNWKPQRDNEINY